jgi:hypothetical protein
MTCKTWSLLAEKYFNPLCTNRFYSPESCPICVSPVDSTPGTCGCPFPLRPRKIHYLRVAWITPPTPENCSNLDPIGDFIITGCGGGYSVEEVTTINTLPPPGTPLCEPYTPSETLRQKRYRVLIDDSYLVGSLRFATVLVEYRRRIAVWSGSSISSYIEETLYRWDGVIAACENNRGRATLLQRGTTENPVHSGIFPPSIRAILSTQPFA